MGTMQKSIHSRELKKLTIWLRMQREEKGLTMRDLAAILHKPHSFVGKIEQGERRLDVVEYVTYCRALKISPVEGIKLNFRNID